MPSEILILKSKKSENLQSKVKIVCLKAKILNSEHEVSLLSPIATNEKIQKNKFLIVVSNLSGELYLAISYSDHTAVM